MRIAVDRDCCIGSGSCVEECPEVFAQDDDGVVVVLIVEPPPELHEAALNAMLACPAAVITIQEDS